jgi:hypothetical protein
MVLCQSTTIFEKLQMIFDGPPASLSTHPTAFPKNLARHLVQRSRLTRSREPSAMLPAGGLTKTQSSQIFPASVGALFSFRADAPFTTKECGTATVIKQSGKWKGENRKQKRESWYFQLCTFNFELYTFTAPSRSKIKEQLFAQ